jgi:hypothetical protein
VADWSAEIVPAVAVKLADVAPAATETVAGTVNAAALPDRLMVAPPVGAPFDNVTEQAAVPPPDRLAGEQETSVTVVWVVRAIETEAELPL